MLVGLQYTRFALVQSARKRDEGMARSEQLQLDTNTKSYVSPSEWQSNACTRGGFDNINAAGKA